MKHEQHAGLLEQVSGAHETRYGIVAELETEHDAIVGQIGDVRSRGVSHVLVVDEIRLGLTGHEFAQHNELKHRVGNVGELFEQVDPKENARVERGLLVQTRRRGAFTRRLNNRVRVQRVDLVRGAFSQRIDGKIDASVERVRQVVANLKETTCRRLVVNVRLGRGRD